MILTDSGIRKLQAGKPPMIAEYVDFEKQLQPNGFDLTVREVHRFAGHGHVDFDNSERKLPETQAIEWEGDWLFLKPGVYKVRTNEVVSLPKDIIAFSQPRSTLLRMGVTSNHAFWDAGFSGRSEFVIHVINEHGLRLKRNARVAQLVFLRLGAESERGYSGVYQGSR